jgi:hypothetical protein
MEGSANNANATLYLLECDKSPERRSGEIRRETVRATGVVARIVLRRSSNFVMNLDTVIVVSYVEHRHSCVSWLEDKSREAGQGTVDL